jgi:diguanylate cyclase (GGDEF)-like protein
MTNQPAGPTLDLLLESLPVVIWLTDARLTVTWARGGAIRLTGIDQLFPNGTDIRSILGEGHPLLAAHQSALTGETRAVDVEWMERSYRTNIQPLRDGAGNITGCLGSAQDVTELKQAERTIVWQAAFDPLTGVLNRARFGEQLETMLLRARRAGQHVTVVVVDIDDFNPVNATYGMTTGDDVLRALTSRIGQSLPDDVLLGRVEGDELALILPDRTAEEVRAFTESIHAQLNEPFLAGERELHLTVSVGAATFPIDGRSAEHLLRCAKAAARRAHQLGGRRSQFFLPALTVDSVQKMELDHGLRHALEHEEFFLVYQPQVRLEDGAVEGLEVLLRWRKDGDVLPAWSFIPRLEETSLMVSVGRWIIDRALAQFQEWREAGLRPGRLAINVGARQLDDESFVTTVRRSLAQHRVPANLLDFEITETAAMQNVETSVRILDDLRQIGTDVTIDDFGTGYSSLNYLKRFTITGLKIDRTFVADVPESRTGAAIVEAMIATARALDLRLVAEGVESEEQAAWLRGAGCASAQGFLFSKPLAADAVAGFLESRRSA